MTRVLGLRAVTCLLLVCSVMPPMAGAVENDYAGARQRMVRDIDLLQREGADDTGRRSFAPATRAVLGRTPRHLFVPRA